MSFDYTKNPLRFSPDFSLLSSVDYVRAGDLYNIYADALILCVGRIKFAREGFVAEFAEQCRAYFDALHVGDEDETGSRARAVYYLVGAENPVPAEFMEYNNLFHRYTEISRHLFQTERLVKIQMNALAG